jgi:hypothetical protein
VSKLLKGILNETAEFFVIVLESFFYFLQLSLKVSKCDISLVKILSAGVHE